jgi:type II secretory pathway component PulF
MKLQNLTISHNEKVEMISNLGTMLSAGISIIECIDSLLEDAKGNQRKVLLTLKEDLNQGNRIYLSFQKFPRVFDKVTINIIKAAEEAGSLEVSLKDIKINLQKENEFNDKIRSALIYPFFIGIVFVGVLLMILIVVVPKI